MAVSMAQWATPWSERRGDEVPGSRGRRTAGTGPAARGAGRALTRYSPWEFMRRVLSTSRGWHRNVAHPPWGEAAGGHQLQLAEETQPLAAGMAHGERARPGA